MIRTMTITFDNYMYTVQQHGVKKVIIYAAWYQQNNSRDGCYFIKYLSNLNPSYYPTSMTIRRLHSYHVNTK